MKFGVELEFTAAIAHANSQRWGGFYEHVLTLMRESGIYDWRYEADASCGNEIVSPVLDGEKGLHQALQVCECATAAQKQFELGRLLGPDAGVHFHFDARDLVKQSQKEVQAIRNVLLMSAVLEPLWFSMNPGARFETAFAAPLNFNLFQMVRARDMVDIRDIWFRHYQGVKGHSDSYRIQHNSYAPTFINDGERRPDKYDWTRYHGLNLVALWKHGTFEFRYTHGSFEPRNIEMWFNLYKTVVEIARSTRTRDIVMACPMNIDDIKTSSINGLHELLYNDLSLAIDFMFKPKAKSVPPLFPRDVKVLRFILRKLIKYNPNCMPMETVKKIWLNDDASFEQLMDYIRDIRVESGHRRRNRYKFTPSPQGIPSNEGEPEAAYPPDFNEEPY
jgi:hypothetical protein